MPVQRCPCQRRLRAPSLAPSPSGRGRHPGAVPVPQLPPHLGALADAELLLQVVALQGGFALLPQLLAELLLLRQQLLLLLLAALQLLVGLLQPLLQLLLQPGAVELALQQVQLAGALLLVHGLAALLLEEEILGTLRQPPQLLVRGAAAVGVDGFPDALQGDAELGAQEVALVLRQLQLGFGGRELGLGSEQLLLAALVLLLGFGQLRAPLGAVVLQLLPRQGRLVQLAPQLSLLGCTG